MENKFDVYLLPEVERFIKTLDHKTQSKVVYNIQKVRKRNDPKLFKKLNDQIWEFRTEYRTLQIRLFAFWDTNRNSVVITTHGIIKKSNKTPKKEIDKAMRIRTHYLNDNK
ncbi:MAG: type II toxin-antitoxin system RelE/ParE family toxin [Saprospiraceae bacterium]|nr:type II toxin-antitoxin system RelE/ParE family toxin [Saprospiraceae bacterium]